LQRLLAAANDGYPVPFLLKNDPFQPESWHIVFYYQNETLLSGKDFRMFRMIFWGKEEDLLFTHSGYHKIQSTIIFSASGSRSFTIEAIGSYRSNLIFTGKSHRHVSRGGAEVTRKSQ
jgi:hypothetical protein